MMDVSCKELRKRAWNRLADGNYGKSLGASFLGAVIGSAGWFFTSGSMTYGVDNYFAAQQRGDETEFTDIFDGFGRYGNTLLGGLLQSIFIALWSILLVIPGIIKTYAYSVTFYVMKDFDLGATEAITKSRELMDGYKWKLFKLELSFIGWYLLSAITFGIGSIFLAPYVRATMAEFYAELLKCNGVELVQVNESIEF
ncbi:MAG: DUF975 family protein [Corallococcus sp.]|nr:DUF975 family protein [Corallococcus sp.]